MTPTDRAPLREHWMLRNPDGVFEPVPRYMRGRPSILIAIPDPAPVLRFDEPMPLSLALQKVVLEGRLWGTRAGDYEAIVYAEPGVAEPLLHLVSYALGVFEKTVRLGARVR